MLIFTLLCSTTDVNQVFRLPRLVQHYLEHKEQNGALNFVAFIKMHYSTDNNEASESQHENLPFKNHITPLVCLVVVLNQQPVIVPATSTFKVFIKTKDSFAPSKDQFLSSQYLSTIWQPPKVA